MEKLTEIPTHFVISDSLVIELDRSDYPAADYSLQLVFISPSHKQAVDSVSTGSTHLLTVDTSGFSSGRVDYQLRVKGPDSFKQVIESGVLIAKTDLFAVETFDGRSHVKKVLDALEAVIEGRASKTVLSKNFDGFEEQHLTHDELIRQRDIYKEKYFAELVAAGKKQLFQTIKPEFTS